MDIVLLQETHLRKIIEFIARWSRFPFQVLAAGSSKARGTAILIRNTVRFEETASYKDPQGQFVLTKGKLDNVKVTLASVYAPNSGQILFMDTVLSKISTWGEGFWLVAGDFNYVADLQLDRTYHQGMQSILKDNTYTALHALFGKYRVVDCWRHLHATDRDYTYYSARHGVHTRLDYCLISSDAVSCLCAADIGSKTLSDHSWVSCELELHEAAPREFNWTLNKSLLDSDLIKRELADEIKACLKCNDAQHCKTSIVWDAFKATLRGVLISKATYLKRLREDERRQLYSKIQQLEWEHKEKGGKRVYANLLKERRKLEMLETETFKKNLVFLKQRYWHNLPKSLKLLAWRVKQRKLENVVHTIKTPSGTLVGTTPEILEEFERYYASLYSSTLPDTQNQTSFFNNNALISHLTEGHSAFLDAPITQEEISKAIGDMKAGKVAGPDGYPGEFFKTFWELLLPPLEATFNAILETGDMPPSWRAATIVPIPKPNKDRTLCKSYRPIALLNTDMKFFTSILARRLQSIIANYVSADQTGFIPGRSMADNVRRTLNIICHGKRNTDPSLLVSIDFEKAFDSIEFSYLKSLLAHMKFGENFRRAIDALYDHPVAKVRVNNRRTRDIDLHRGTRQGCPLSPLIFALCIEPLANWIRSSKDIVGVTAGGVEHKTSLFTDDLVVYITKPRTSLKALHDVLHEFYKVSGLKMNFEKSDIFPIKMTQAERELLTPCFSFRWVHRKWTHLGIDIPLELQQLYALNFTRTVADIKQRLNAMKTHNYSWMDRLHVVKAFIFPKFLFLFRMLPIAIPQADLNSWQRLLNDFLWSNKCHRISFRILRQTARCGGMGVPDLHLYNVAANLTTVLRMNNDPQAINWLSLELQEDRPPSCRSMIWAKNLRSQIPQGMRIMLT